MSVQIIPENAPFSPEQRAWLNGFIAGLVGLQQAVGSSANKPMRSTIEEDEDYYPWHDESLPLEERMKLAEGRPYELRLMAAMGQMDCGQCGYLCKSYAGAIAKGEESDLSLCVPGGKTTAKMLKALVKECPPFAESTRPVSNEQPINLYTRKNPFNARLKAVSALNADGSFKDTRHVVIDLKDSGIHYRPGDSLGVFPRNCPELVDAIIAALGATGDEVVSTPSGSRPLREALIVDFDITKPADEAIEYLASVAADPDEAQALRQLAEAGADEGQDLLEILETYSSAWPDPRQLVTTLGRLQPRLYSIASSQRLHPDEVHTTVGVVRYQRSGRNRKGVASTFFADRLMPEERVRVYIQPTHDFRLPADGNVPVIMVGPGTGIAPFRAFLQERQAHGDTGRNWLFFGNSGQATDFLYRGELEGFLESGLLTRLDTAFSRDQQKKIYVQQRMSEQGPELWDWLQEGAFIYVCGDAKRMARDVDAALRQIIEDQGGLSEDEAEAFVKMLIKDKRYLRDVY